MVRMTDDEATIAHRVALRVGYSWRKWRAYITPEDVAQHAVMQMVGMDFDGDDQRVKKIAHGIARHHVISTLRDETKAGVPLSLDVREKFDVSAYDAIPGPTPDHDLAHDMQMMLASLSPSARDEAVRLMQGMPSFGATRDNMAALRVAAHAFGMHDYLGRCRSEEGTRICAECGLRKRADGVSMSTSRHVVRCRACLSVFHQPDKKRKKKS